MTSHLKRISSAAVFLFLFLNFGFAQKAIDPLRALYNDDTKFHQLSTGARMILEKHFGSKNRTKSEQDGEHTFRKIPSAPFALIPDVLVNNPSADATNQDTQSTSALVLGSGTNVVAAFTDSGSFTGSNNKFTGFSSSADSGDSFTDHGALPTNTEGDSGSPVLARDTTSGTVYLSSVGFTTGEFVQVFRSLDNGGTFGFPVNATPGFIGTGDFQDKPWIAVDNFPGTGQGSVYLAWRHFPFTGNGGIRLTRSTDGGNSWGPSQGVLIVSANPSNVQGANVIVGSDHSVYVFWYDQNPNPRQIKVSKSTDGGTTFGAPITVSTLAGTGNNGDLALNGGFETNSFPQAAANPVNNNLYAVYNDDPAGVDKSNVFLRKSSDGGATWSTPLQINNDSTTNDQFFPSIAVTPDGTALMVSWYDKRSDPTNALIDRFGEIFTIDGSGNLNSIGEFPISNQSFPVVVGQDPAVSSTYMGEYDQSAADNNFFYVAWGDNRGSNQFHAHQPDVRFARIPVAGPGAILDLNSSAIDDSTGNNNGVIDFNECFNLNITIRNDGTSTATGITGTLSTTTPGVTILQTTASFPDLPVGATGMSITPFQLETSDTFNCGVSPIDLQLDVSTTGQGNFVLPLSLQTGAIQSPAQFNSNTVTPIPDLGTVDVPLTVSGINGSIGKVTVSMYITHTYDADLDISLVSPDNTIVELTSDNGGSGDNYGSNCSPQTNRTTFDESASMPISSGTAPFLGSFKPEGDLSDFNGKIGSAVNGDWKLRVTDDSGVDVGTVNCWSLFISETICTDGGGVCGCPSINIDPPSLPSGTVGVAYSQNLIATGGAPPYTFVVSSGALPAGLTLDPTGLISGNPAASGTFSFTVKVTDSGSCVSFKAYSLDIGCTPIALSPTSLPDAPQNGSYSQTITASGGIAPYSFAVTAGSLPPGLNLSPTGILSGIPTTQGSFPFDITATDSAGCTGTQSYTLNVVSCGFCDDFEDGVLATNWSYPKGTPSEANGFLTLTSIRKAQAIATPAFSGCSTCTVAASLKTAGGTGNKVWLLAWYIDKNNTVELLMKEENDRWVLKQRSNGSVVAKAKATLTIDPNTSYNASINFDGTSFQVSIDGTVILTVPAVGLPNGTVGFQSKGTTASFDYIQVN